MRIFDISMPLSPGMLIYPGDPGFEQEWVRTIAGLSLIHI